MMRFISNCRARTFLIAAGLALSAVSISAPARAETVYAVDGSVDALYTFDLTSGTGTMIGPLHPDLTRYTTPQSMAIRPSDGEIFIVNNSPVSDLGLSTVDSTTGLATHIGGGFVGTITFDNNLRLLTISGGAVATLSQTTGAVVSSVGSGLPTDIRGMDFNPMDGLLYAVSGLASGATISKIDPGTGNLVSSVAFTSSVTGSVVGGLLVDSRGTIHCTTNSPFDNLFEVDPVTGDVSNVRTLSIGIGQGMGLLPSRSLCPADVNDDGFVSFGDLLLVITNWGPCPGPPGCAGDIDETGDVDFTDLLIVLTSWGPCP